MSRVIQVGVGSLIVLALIVSPVVVAVRQEAKTRNFRVVRPGVLYRSGQMSQEGLRRILDDYHIKTVINLRDGRTEKDKAEEAFCKSQDVAFLRILPSRWGDDGGSVPVEAGMRRFREILSDPRNHPVLVHCYAGIHRAGSYCAIYRMEFEHWSNAQAIAEMKACGYTNLDEELDILSFMEQYRPTWMPKVEDVEGKEKPRAKKAHKRKPAAKARPKHHHQVS
ncbi:MAG TPA: tyrosine-protein phosphatase [Gemmataceae bacterium]|nr:tyrosine-protein phosphatase [Gemmataceae bacterium]